MASSFIIANRIHSPSPPPPLSSLTTILYSIIIILSIIIDSIGCLKYYHYSIDHPQQSNLNPYSSFSGKLISSNQTFFLRKKSRKLNNNNQTLLQQQQQQYPLKQWQPSLNRNFNNATTTPRQHPYHVLIGEGRYPVLSSDNETVTASGSNVQPISIIRVNSFQRQPLMDQQQQQYPGQEPMIDIQEQPLPNYQCDSIIQDYRFIIESPEYPAQYPFNRICSYYIGKNRSDVCQIELTISDMDIEDTAQCTDDYLDLGNTSIKPLNQTKQTQQPQQQQQGERLCGLMLRNTRRKD
ncbi:hypothetical protein BLA29_004400 [Euroglyphus maynei]|uniref:CUB domain-containing protein n=1 Tax=Euroglyphus maynei TaxID=6958 RepID=A0A1Y3BHM1_EURMA|nr:hypothetical protein BLA29_004400 [Euroglyphus maynei]